MAVRKIVRISTVDTPEMIAICLNCDLPRCVAKCQKMLNAQGKSAPQKRLKLKEMFPYKGGFMTIMDASRQFGIKQGTLRSRIKNQGLTLEQAIEIGVPNYTKRKGKTK